jgi:hypothetical protein
MSLTLGRFTWNTTITAGTNNVFKWTEWVSGSATPVSVTLNAATYPTPEALLTAVTSQMTDQSGNTGEGLVYSGSLSTTGIASMAISGSTGATSTMAISAYSDGSTAAHVLGFSDGVATSAAEVSGTYQASSAFYFKVDGPDLVSGAHATTIDWESEHNAPMNVALDGTVTGRPIGSTREIANVSVGHMPQSSTWAADYPNQSQTLENLFDFVVGGNSRAFRWYLDASDTTSWTTVHWEPMGQNFSYQPQRADPGLARWSHQMKLRKHV